MLSEKQLIIERKKIQQDYKESSDFSAEIKRLVNIAKSKNEPKLVEYLVGLLRKTMSGGRKKREQ